MAEKEQKFPAPLGKCPICKQFMSIEMLPVGLSKKNEKGKQKIMPVFDSALNQTIRWTGEMLGRAAVAAFTVGFAANVPAKRHLYYTCNNKECTACYSPQSPKYFEKTPYGTFELKGDIVGLNMDMLRAAYNAKKKMKKLKKLVGNV